MRTDNGFPANEIIESTSLVDGFSIIRYLDDI